ncbi:MAG: retropepsin-like aspartic protease [Bacteroidota bacterium]
MQKYLLFILSFIFSACSSTSNFDKGYLEKEVKDTVEVPFEMYRGLIILEVAFNGVSGNFLFDNGASYSCVNKDFADKAGIVFRSGSSIRDGNNNRTVVRQSIAEDISITDIHFKKTGVYLIDTKKFFPCNEDIDGILGASIINKINWLIDFKRNILKISSQSFKNGGLPIKIGISSNNSSFMGFELNGFPVKAKIDFGYTGALKLRMKEYRQKFSGVPALRVMGVSSLSVTGLGKSDTTYEFYEGIQMKKGETTLAYPPEVELTKNLKQQARIGMDFFKNYELVINSSEREYQLLPYEEARDVETMKSYGVWIYEEKNMYKVIQVQPDVLGEKDIVLMDEIESVNGKSTDEFANYCVFKEFLKEIREKEESLYLRIKGKETEYELPYQDMKFSALP